FLGFDAVYLVVFSVAATYGVSATTILTKYWNRSDDELLCRLFELLKSSFRLKEEDVFALTCIVWLTILSRQEGLVKSWAPSKRLELLDRPGDALSRVTGGS